MDIQEEIGFINQKLEEIPLSQEPKNLYDPIAYFLRLGGKRFRPLLTLIGASLYTQHYRKHIHPALATEVFHNFSLIHDDIMDKAPLRRGMATIHEKWNPNIAILSGDVTFVIAYQLLAHCEAKKLPEALRLFNICATEVCQGQQYDMDFEAREDVSIPEYLEMIRLKTAVLLGFSLSLGALLADAPQEDVNALKEFGELIGIGFQLQDDYLDAFGTQAAVGKTIGGDILQNKKTFLYLKTYELASTAQKKELDQWLKVEDRPAEKIAAIKQIMTDLGVKEITKKLMDDYFEKGFAHLENLAAAPEKVAFLKEFSYSLIKRNN